MFWARHKILQVVFAAISCSFPLLLLILLPHTDGRDRRVSSLGGLSVRFLAAGAENNQLWLYAATDRGGIYRSMDSGATWSAANRGLPLDIWNGIQIKALIVIPAKPDNLYVITGPQPRQRAIFKSTDAGGSWLKVSQELGHGEIQTLAFSSADEQTLYATVAGRVYHSVDGAHTWTWTGWLPSDTVPSQLLVDPHRPGAMYLGTAGQGLYHSADQGRSWQKVHRELDNQVIQALAVGLQEAKTVYVGTTDRIYLLVPGSAGWQMAGYALEGNSVHTIAVVPAPTELVYANTDTGIYATTDQGHHWTQISSSRLHQHTTSIALDVQTQTLVRVDAQDSVWTQAFSYAATTAAQEQAPLDRATARLFMPTPSPGLSTTGTTAAVLPTSTLAEMPPDADVRDVTASPSTPQSSLPDEGTALPTTQLLDGGTVVTEATPSTRPAETLTTIQVVTPQPTGTPTLQPVATATPIVLTPPPKPVPANTVTPAGTPTATPNTEPTATSTREPTVPPTREPTSTPTREPTATTTSTATRTPTPTVTLTQEPGVTATNTPTTEPTATGTPAPTATPADEPATTPTREPTFTPTRRPTATPTRKPTATPTRKPTVTPTREPTATPTDEPTPTPTREPTATATSTPTRAPTAMPTDEPTSIPTDEPTATLTSIPTYEPTATPTSAPPLEIGCFSDGNVRDWHTGLEAPWYTSYNESYSGGCSTASGDTANDQQSWLRGEIQGPGTISFYWRVSSEWGDELQFRVCDHKQAQISGERGWTYVSYELTSSTTCTVEWRYVKDAHGTANQDRGWIDDVVVTFPNP